LNWWLGANDVLVALVNDHLRSYRPWERFCESEEDLETMTGSVLKPQPPPGDLEVGTQSSRNRTQSYTPTNVIRIDRNKIQAEVDKALEELDDHLEDEQTENFEDRMVVLRMKMDELGPGVLSSIVEWYLTCHQRVPSQACLQLYHSDSVFATSHYDIAALALLDVPLLLMNFFDQNWETLEDFLVPENTGPPPLPFWEVIPIERWFHTFVTSILKRSHRHLRNNLLLQTVCISAPAVKVCNMTKGKTVTGWRSCLPQFLQGSGSWEINPCVGPSAKPKLLNMRTSQLSDSITWRSQKSELQQTLLTDNSEDLEAQPQP